MSRTRWLSREDTLRAELLGRFDRVDRKLNVTSQGLEIMAKAIDDLRAEVVENTNVAASAMQLLSELSTRIKEGVSNEDPEALLQIARDLDANNQALAKAVIANTPVAGTTVPPAPEPSPMPDVPTDSTGSGSSGSSDPGSQPQP